jgi:multicomponent Na+:H+ antiporter subunit E
MILLLINILLALAWAAVTGSFSQLNLLFGFLLGIFALYLIREQVGTTGYFERSRKIISLAGLFFYELVISAVRVLLLVIRPKLDINPGIIAYPLKVDRDFEITLLANLISLTPGTISVDVSGDRRRLFVHTIDCSDPETLKQDIANGFERKILEAFR